jgi:hypothetical protein
MKRLILYGLIGIALSTALISVLCVLRRTIGHRYFYIILQQTIEVPDPSIGTYYSNSEEMPFYWNEITSTKKFAGELALRISGYRAYNLDLPDFESGVFIDEISREIGTSDKLSLRLIKGVVHERHTYIGEGRWLKETPKEDKEELRNLFEIGREIFLEEIAQYGINGIPQGEIKIFKVPFKPIRSPSDLINIIGLPIFSTITSGIVVVFTIIIFNGLSNRFKKEKAGFQPAKG